MTTLLDLPEETIANILSLVSEDGPVPMVGSGDYPPHSASYSAYFNAALTCKDLHRIVQPELYKFVAFDGNPYRVGRDGSQGGHVDMHSFLRTLFEAPHLRRSIHEIHIKHCSSLMKSQSRTSRVWPDRSPPIWEAETVLGEALASLFEEGGSDEDGAEAENEGGVSLLGLEEVYGGT
ncbi:uncharacterized protein MYCGRDRAFT_105666 [Zymoseptoria tritici IPO323]|uniref:F-box domain-containing protein n=1 Tax=Zymoseptoria tritici (strain CBS 115943 / IPO323) TaxID=336722 RepID=F9XJ54_ZYMTI|nr:uncharacterized protein MYCGRDRAFT_105666 [Zymoseptoria tritici IPO323]EGP84288.1 hypothetical protein MYCGRDRAFT_105666 [Zymoseptoria tritici IPO323]